MPKLNIKSNNKQAQQYSEYDEKTRKKIREKKKKLKSIFLFLFWCFSDVPSSKITTNKNFSKTQFAIVDIENRKKHHITKARSKEGKKEKLLTNTYVQSTDY